MKKQYDIGLDFDGVVSIGFKPPKGSIIITGRTEDRKQETLNELNSLGFDTNIPIIFYPNKQKLEDNPNSIPQLVGSYKADTIKELGIIKFYEDEQEQADIIKQKNPDVKIVLVSDLKEKDVLVYDYKLFTELAASLVKYFRNVYYFTPWQDAFPDSNKQATGLDFKGLKRIQKFWDYADKVDLIVCFDTYTGDFVDYLRRIGKRVWGAGSAEQMELERWSMRRKQKEIGLPTQDTLLLKSVDDLEIYFKGIKNLIKERYGSENNYIIKKFLDNLKEKYNGFNEEFYTGKNKMELVKEWIEGAKNKFVKLNMRGDIETFFVPDYESSLSKFNALSDKLGHRQNTKDIEFVIESKIEGLEPGFDGIQINGSYLTPTLWGIEKKGAGYIGIPCEYESLPMPIKIINNKLSEVFQEYLPTNSFFSTEFVISEEDKKPYLIDPTVRNPAPIVSAIYSELYTNLDKILYYGAEGEIIEPQMIDAKYVGGVCLDSEWANDHELEVEVPKQISQWVKLRNVYQKDGKYYAIKGFSSICSVIAFGNTIDEVINKVKERVKKVKAYGLQDSDTGGLDLIKEELLKLKSTYD